MPLKAAWTGCHTVHSSGEKYPTASNVNGTKVVKTVSPPHLIRSDKSKLSFFLIF